MSIPSTPLNQSVTATTSNGALVAPMNFLTNTDNLNTIANGVGFVNGTLPVSKGGTNATSLTGYVKGNGAATFTASPTVPSTDITGLGTMSVQNANTVAITGGNITGITDLAIADGGTGASTAANARTNLGLGSIATQNANAVAITGGNITGITDLAVVDGGTGTSSLTGYVKGNGTTALLAVATIPNTDITGLGTMSTQNASTVAITGGNITGITDLAIADGGTGASTAPNARTNLGLGTIATQNSNAVSITGGNITGITDLAVADGGTGASSLTGYIKGNGTLAFTALGTIPNTDITGLGSMSTQSASNVAITGGNITGITALAVVSGGTGLATTPNNGALLIGNGTGYEVNTLTAGLGIDITNGSGAITIASTVTGMYWKGPWSATTFYQPNDIVLAHNSSYICIIGNDNTPPWEFPFNNSWQFVAAGVLFRGDWNNTDHFYINDTVFYQGESYICVNDNSDTPPNDDPSYWAKIVVKGANGTNGANGTSFIWKGAYTEGDSYSINDVVQYLGSSYICIQNIDEAFAFDPLDWSLMAYGFSSPVTIAQGGTGATTVSGARTNLGLGSIATQNANAVAITGGNITGITDLAVSDGGTGASTLTGYVKGNGTAALVAVGTIPYTDITGLGTMSTQNSTNISVTGGSMNNVALGTPVSVVLTNGTGLPLATGVTGTLPIANGGTGQTAANPAFNALAPAQTGNNGKYLTTDGSNTSWAALVGGGTVTSVSGTGTVSGIQLSGNVTISGSLTLGGALDLSSPPAIGSNVPNTAAFTDAYATTFSNGFTNVAAAGTVTTLTASSVRDWTVTGSGGQTYQLPDATTLRNGATFQFNNNQSSGTVVVRNNSATTVATIQSGGYVEIILLSNATAAGSWDVHNQAPSNVTWSTNTFDYPGSITSATWNGNVVTINRGGTNAATAQAAINNLAGATTSGYYLRGNGSNVVMAAIQAADVPTLNQNTSGSAATLTNSRSIYGGSFNGSADVTGIIASNYGGTGNGYAKFSGPTTSEKTFTLPDANATLLYAGGALGTPSSGTLTNATGLPVSTGISGLGTNVATALATNVGTSGAFVVNGGALGTPSSGTLSNATGLPLTTGVTGTLPLANGGTNASSAGQATAKLAPITSTVTSATTVTLTNASNPVQIFTGTASQVIVLPVTSTLETGWVFTIVNNSTSNISIQTSAGTALFTVLSATNAVCRCIATGSTAVTDWEAGITEFSGYAGQGGSVMMSFSPSASGAMSFTGTAGSNSVFGSALTTGTLTIGGPSQTSLTTIGQSTVGNTIGIGTGVTSTGNTQTINIGNAGASGSTTAITIGGTAGTSTITLNGTTSGAFNGTVGATTASTGAFTTLSASGTATAGPNNTGTGLALLQLLGGSGTNGGASIYFGTNGTAYSSIGQSSGILGGTTTDFVIYANNSGQSIKFYAGGSGLVGAISNTGLAVTGSITSTSAFISNGPVTTNGASRVTLDYDSGAAKSRVLGWGATTGTAGTLTLGVLSSNASVLATDVATITSTGLAVTGQITATYNDISGIVITGNSGNAISLKIVNSNYSSGNYWNIANDSIGGLTFNHNGTDIVYIGRSGGTDANFVGTIYSGALGTGLVYSSSGTLTSTNPSDARLKTDITDIDYGLSSILALRPVSYKWKSDTVNQGTQYGFIAQEVQTVMPDLVKEFETTEDGETVIRLGLEKEGIYAALVKSVQELNANLVAQVAALSQRLAALESK
jgi:hypothetical protein